MKWFSVYRVADGEVVSVFMADESAAQANVPDDHGLLEGCLRPTDGRVVDGVFVPYTEVQASIRRSRPGPTFAWNTETLSWVDLRSEQDVWSEVRQRRDALLRSSDWTALPDVPMSLELRGQWAVYRQALRDITSQADPSAIVWPTPPT